MILQKVRSNFSPIQDLWIFVHILFLITILPLLLRFMSLSRLLAFLTSNDVNVCRNSDMEKVQDRIVKYTDYILSRNFWIYRHSCLKRSLVLYHFLRKSGINVSIRVGVRYVGTLPYGEDKKLEGHAWLVCGDEYYLENNIEEAKTCKVIYCFPVDMENS